MNFLLFVSFIPIKNFNLPGPVVYPDSLAPFFASLAVAEEVSQEMAAQQE